MTAQTDSKTAKTQTCQNNITSSNTAV